MSFAIKNLPQNPYSREPIKDKARLAGRAKEESTLKYYLNLTKTGQSPQVALIGARGVGKTSLLNAAAQSAVELKLSPVRVELNELKSRTQGQFWFDFYASMILALAKEGCWGGLNSPTYLDLLRAMYSKQTPTSGLVLQFPQIVAAHKEVLDLLPCPDAIITYDLGCAINELKSHGILGMAILIDEANCFSRSVAPLQMFRNVVPRRL